MLSGALIRENWRGSPSLLSGNGGKSEEGSLSAFGCEYRSPVAVNGSEMQPGPQDMVNSAGSMKKRAWGDEENEVYGVETPQIWARAYEGQKRSRCDHDVVDLRDIGENGEFMDTNDENREWNVNQQVSKKVDIEEEMMMVNNGEYEEECSNLSASSQSMRARSIACRFAECSEVLNESSLSGPEGGKQSTRQKQRSLLDYAFQGNGNTQRKIRLQQQQQDKDRQQQQQHEKLEVGKCFSCSNMVTIIPSSSMGAHHQLACNTTGANHGVLCHFCGRPACSPSCSNPCVVCADVFCNMCSTVSYASQYDRVICIDCKMTE